jgi:DNA-binding response OmpR family regulator
VRNVVSEPAAPIGAVARARVLLVEDDDTIAEPLAEALELEGFAVERVRTGSDALVADEPDFVLLDLGLPDLDGREVCRRLRARSAVPVIVVTARADELDRVLLLEMGADDYVVKPFGFRELVARIRAVQRRVDSARGRATRLEFGSLVIDRGARRVWVEGDELALTPKEFDLLAFLADAPAQVRTREEIIGSSTKSGTSTGGARRRHSTCTSHPSVASSVDTP